MSLPELTIFVGSPDTFAPRAAWVLQTVMAPLGRRVAITRDPAAAGGAALAYAASPVAGVPTIPCSAAAMDMFAAERPVPAGSFAAVQAPPSRASVAASRAGGASQATAARTSDDQSGGDPPADADDGAAIGAWPADPDAGFAVAFDLVASAFVLLACWDEHTTGERDQYGRLPYSASIFAGNPSLRIDDPAVDRYAELLRDALAPRLAELGLEPLPPPGWVWRASPHAGAGDGSGTRFALALTHDLDNLWRWTPRGLAAAGYRTARAVRRRDAHAVARELGDGADWLLRHLPRGSDPFWTFPQLLAGEDRRDVTSTFYVIARHTHARDGNQPATYARRIPQALALVTAAGCEVGLHGNHADLLSVDDLARDRDDLARRAAHAVHGIRYHYLRALYHETLPLLEHAGFSYDTTLAFAEHEGYRCGCSFPFRPYWLEQERPLDLVELPLAVMDGTLQEAHYRGLTAADAERAAAVVLGRALRSGGAAALLWHNNRFDKRVSRGYDGVYWRLLDQALARGAWCGRADEIVTRWKAATT